MLATANPLFLLSSLLFLILRLCVRTTINAIRLAITISATKPIKDKTITSMLLLNVENGASEGEAVALGVWWEDAAVVSGTGVAVVVVLMWVDVAVVGGAGNVTGSLGVEGGASEGEV